MAVEFVPENLRDAGREPDGVLAKGFTGSELTQPESLNFAGKSAAEAALDAARLFVSRWVGQIFNTWPNNNKKPDHELLRIVREELKTKMDIIVKEFGYVTKQVEAVRDCSVRNESHLKQIRKEFESFEATMREVLDTTKESLTAEMKLLFDAQLKELKALHDKSTIQKMDSVLTDLELASTFPRRIAKLSESAAYYVTALAVLLGLVELNYPRLQVLSAKLEELPVTCKPYQLEKGKFSDFGRTSSDLLHKYFHSGPNSGYNVSFSADEAERLGALISGDGGTLSLNAADFRPWIMKLKSDCTRDQNVGCGAITFPNLYSSDVKGIVSVPFPVSSVKAKVHYLHKYGGLLASVQLGDDTLVNLSCIFGMKAFSVGADVGFNPVDRTLMKYDAALRYNKNGFDVALMTRNQNDTFAGALCFERDKYAIGLENSYTISSRVLKMFVGMSYAFDAATFLKARIGLQARDSPAEGERGRQLVDKRATAGIALVRKWGRCAAGLSLEVDLHVQSAPRFGLFLKFGAPKNSSTA